jgi:hypothetical protein
MSAPEAPCGLCLKTAVLQNSHLLPASGYRLARSGPDEAIHNPIHITSTKSFPSDKQITDYFLCWDCEQRFSTHGENYVMNQCARNGKFPLRDLLRTGSPLHDLGDLKIYEIMHLLGEKTAQYLYFGASVFWRAAARAWSIDGETIGPLDFDQHQDELRRYLLDEAGFPEDCRLIVQASSENEMTDMVLTPHKTNDCHKFYIHGLLFTIVFDDAATKCDEIALNSTKGKFMLLSPLKSEPLYQGIRARVQSQASASDLLERIRQKIR